MKKLTAGIALVLLFVLVTSTAVSAKGPAPKATGSVGYYQPGYHFSFNAQSEAGRQGKQGKQGKQETRIAKGQVENRTSSGDSYHAVVKCAAIDGKDAWFLAFLDRKSVSDWGPYVFVKVHDGGTPGTKGDHIWAQFVPDLSLCPDLASHTPAGSFDVLSGNIVVHK